MTVWQSLERFIDFFANKTLFVNGIFFFQFSEVYVHRNFRHYLNIVFHVIRLSGSRSAHRLELIILLPRDKHKNNQTKRKAVYCLTYTCKLLLSCTVIAGKRRSLLFLAVSITNFYLQTLYINDRRRRNTPFSEYLPELRCI